MKGVNTWVLSRVGDATLVASFEQRIDPLVNDAVLQVAASMRDERYIGVRDVVESYCAVTAHFDPLRTNVQAVAESFERSIARVCTARETPAVDESPRGPAVASHRLGDRPPRLHTVPVCYGDGYGADLDEVAVLVGLTPDEVVRRHVAVTYRVYMLGFLPGFAYMGSLSAELAVDRRRTPRLHVPAGSVGVAGRQTGIYPMAAPGGWQLIGRTPLRPFSPARAEAFLFQAGDRVRFEPIDAARFDALETAERGGEHHG